MAASEHLGEQFGSRNFEVHEGQLHVGGRPYPFAQVRKSTTQPRLTFIHVPTESGWGIHAHLIHHENGEPAGRSGHTLGKATVIHRPTLDHVLKEEGRGGEGFAFHVFPEETPGTGLNTYGRRVLKTVDSPAEFHDLVKYVSSLPGGSAPRIPE